MRRIKNYVKELKYVGDVHKSYICSFCHEALIEPFETIPYAHVFCLKCSQKVFKNKSICPNCNALVTGQKSPITLVRDYLNDLIVLCPNKGCEKELKREH